MRIRLVLRPLNTLVFDENIFSYTFWVPNMAPKYKMYRVCRYALWSHVDLPKGPRKKYFRLKQMCSADVGLTLYAIICHQFMVKVVLTWRYEVVKYDPKTTLGDTEALFFGPFSHSHISPSRRDLTVKFFQVRQLDSTATWPSFIAISFLDVEFWLCENEENQHLESDFLNKLCEVNSLKNLFHHNSDEFENCCLQESRRVSKRLF